MHKSVKTIGPYLITLLICLIILSYLYGLTIIDINLPISYTGDSLSAVSVMKGISDNGNWWTNPYLGGAEGQYYSDQPFSDGLSFLLIRGISLLTTSPFAIYNYFFFLTFLLVALTSLFVLLKLGIHVIPAILSSLLYTFIPYHQMRFDHIYLVPYFMIPLTSLVAIWMLNGELSHARLTGQPRIQNILSNRKLWASILIGFLSASTGLYYAFFTCFFFMVVLVINLVNRKKILNTLLTTMTIIASVGIGVFLNLIPAISYLLKNGSVEGTELMRRLPSDAEIYALKLIQLVLPRPNHRIGFLSAITDRYMKISPQINENITSSLGIIGSIGFLALILFLFIRRQSGGEEKSFKTLTDLSRLNLSAILLGTVGGLGSFIAYVFNFGAIRCYNRLSIYIGFFSLATVGILITNLAQRLDQRPLIKKSAQKLHAHLLRNGLLILLCGVLLLGGIYDQTTTVFRKSSQQDAIRMQVDSDQSFVEMIEMQLNKGDMVFQLPHFCYPSQGGYELFKGYIYSVKLIWSFGSMQGRKQDLWEHTLEAMSNKEMLIQLTTNGYSGIYIDCRLYKNADVLLADLEALLDQKPLVSKDGSLAFFKLKKSV